MQLALRLSSHFVTPFRDRIDGFQASALQGKLTFPVPSIDILFAFNTRYCRRGPSGRPRRLRGNSVKVALPTIPELPPQL